MILPCTCKHDFQDKEYGKGLRAHNEIKPEGINRMARCTVCAAERAVKASQAALHKPKK